MHYWYLKSVNLDEFEKFNQNIPGFNPIHKNAKNVSTALLVGYWIRDYSFANNNLGLDCRIETGHTSQPIPEISVPRTFLLNYKMEEVRRNNLIAVFSVLKIYIIGFISLFFYWKFGKKKLNRFLWKGNRRNTPNPGRQKWNLNSLANGMLIKPNKKHKKRGCDCV